VSKASAHGISIDQPVVAIVETGSTDSGSAAGDVPLWLIIVLCVGSLMVLSAVGLLFYRLKTGVDTDSKDSPVEKNHCSKCGNEYIPDSKFCRMCGAPRTEGTPAAASQVEGIKTEDNISPVTPRMGTLDAPAEGPNTEFDTESTATLPADMWHEDDSVSHFDVGLEFAREKTTTTVMTEPPTDDEDTTIERWVDSDDSDSGTEDLQPNTPGSKLSGQAFAARRFESMSEVQIVAPIHTETDITEEIYDSEDEDVIMPQLAQTNTFGVDLQSRFSFDKYVDAETIETSVEGSEQAGYLVPTGVDHGANSTVPSTVPVLPLPSTPVEPSASAIHTTRIDMTDLVPQDGQPNAPHTIVSQTHKSVEHKAPNQMLSQDEEEWNDVWMNGDDEEEEMPQHQFVPEMEWWGGETPRLTGTAAMLAQVANFQDGVFAVDEDSVTAEFYDTEELTDSSDED
jgi:hypothetical protein